eukprot:m.54105 g.54105  ORF g.54105 m.54105 type:complete len:223 (+) comp11393_c0_seq1:189-857(+)
MGIDVSTFLSTDGDVHLCYVMSGALVPHHGGHYRDWDVRVNTESGRKGPGSARLRIEDGRLIQIQIPTNSKVVRVCLAAAREDGTCQEVCQLRKATRAPRGQAAPGYYLIVCDLTKAHAHDPVPAFDYREVHGKHLHLMVVLETRGLLDRYLSKESFMANTDMFSCRRTPSPLLVLPPDDYDYYYNQSQPFQPSPSLEDVLRISMDPAAFVQVTDEARLFGP